MSWVFNVLVVIGAAYVAYMVYGHGVPWVYAKVKSLAGSVAGWFKGAH